MADPEKSFIENVNIIAANIDQLTAYQIALNNGFVGTEAEWLLSIKGADGADGVEGKSGANGESAYQIAVNNGFVGTEAEWLLSIKGEKGADGIIVFTDLTPEQILSLRGDIGEQGESGANGESAYQIAINNGFIGTEAEWIASLNGADGENGANGLSAYQIAVNNGFVGTEAQWIAIYENALSKSGGTMTGAITALRETKVVMGANDINLNTGNLFTKTISAPTTLTVSNWLPNGNANSFIIELTNAGSSIITWFAGLKWSGGIAPTLTANGVDILGFYSHDGGVTVRGMVLAKDSK